MSSVLNEKQKVPGGGGKWYLLTKLKLTIGQRYRLTKFTSRHVDCSGILPLLGTRDVNLGLLN